MAFIPKRDKNSSIPRSVSPLGHIFQSYVNIVGPRGAVEVREAALRQQYMRLDPKDIPTHPDAEAWRKAYTQLHKMPHPNPNHAMRALPWNVTSRHPGSRIATYDRRGWSIVPPPYPFAKQGFDEYKLDPKSHTYRDASTLSILK